MSELDAAHVERCRIAGNLARVVDEYELRVRVDEAADQPRASGPVDVTVRTGRPPLMPQPPRARRQLLDRAHRKLALGRREVVPRANPAQLAPKAGQASAADDPATASAGSRPPRSPPGTRPQPPPSASPAPLLRGRAELADPDRRLPRRVRHLLGQPLEPLAVTAVKRQRDQPVQELRRSQPLQLPPHRDPRRRGPHAQPVREQHPLRPRRPVQQRNRGCTSRSCTTELASSSPVSARAPSNS